VYVVLLLVDGPSLSVCAVVSVAVQTTLRQHVVKTCVMHTRKKLVANEAIVFYCVLFVIHTQQDALTHNLKKNLHLTLQQQSRHLNSRTLDRRQV
jgi:hypothetical protein